MTMRFKETQAWANLWFRPLVIGNLIVIVLAVGMWIIAGRYETPDSTNPLLGLKTTLLTFIGIAILLWCSAMVTTVKADGVHICYWPFHLLWHRHVRPEQIASVEQITEPSVWSFGIHTDFKEWLYNVRGHDFVRLTLTNGKIINIGTQQPEELLRAVEKIMIR